MFDLIKERGISEVLTPVCDREKTFTLWEVNTLKINVENPG
jgi:hypothetical protein